MTAQIPAGERSLCVEVSPGSLERLQELARAEGYTRISGYQRVLDQILAAWPSRALEALRLQELVERTLQNDGEVSFEHPITGRYQVHIGVRDEPASGATLDEAVEAALKELDS